MRASAFLLAGLGLLLAGCSGGPGATLFWEAGKTQTLAGTTQSCIEIQAPYSLTLAEKRRFFLHLANPGNTSVELFLQGAQPGRVTLPPGRWTRVSGETAIGRPRLDWRGASLFLAEAYLLPEQSSARPNLLLISLDTLRHDFFDAIHMPETFALFRDGRVMERMYTSAPWTLPAHASLLSGQYPAKHGVRLPRDRLAAEVETIGEVLQKSGYYTLALTEGNYMAAAYGLHQGFHLYHENAPQMMATDLAAISKLEANLNRLERELAALEDAPVFAFFHSYEVHCPYVARGGLRDPEGIGHTQWLLDNDGKPLDDATLARLRALYAAEVAYADRLLAPVIRRLLGRGDWVVALVSDHGEEFGEHGGLLHADTLYQETTRIPFAIAGKGVRAPRSQPPPGSIVDVAPTLLGLLDLAPPAQWQGRDLRRAMPVDRPLFAESFFLGPQIAAKDPRLTAVIKNQNKLIQTQNFGKTTAELYDLSKDLQEKDNLQTNRTMLRDSLFLLIEAYLNHQGLESEAAGELTPEQLETMRALGYIQ